MKTWCLCLASGLEYLHLNKVQYVKIDACDIFCGEQGQIVISAFNFESWITGAPPSGAYKAENSYPQEYLEPIKDKFPLDIFSLGLVFGQMLVALAGSKYATFLSLWDDKYSGLHGRNFIDMGAVFDGLYTWPGSPSIEIVSMYIKCVAPMLRPQSWKRPGVKDVIIILSRRLEEWVGPTDSCSCWDTEVDMSTLPEFGWQQNKEQYLFDASAETTLEVTERGTLGRGRTGEVEEVTVPGFDVAMARKRIFLTRVNASSNRLKAAIRTEIEHLRLLDHRHIVRMVGCYQEPSGRNNTNFFVLMHPAGDTDLRIFLEHTCKQASTKDMDRHSEWISNWYTCLATAVAHIHFHGIHHEDIKPANIVHVGERVYLTDFSSSRKISSWDETSTESPTAATRLFAAPEALYDNDVRLRHGSQTDMYSLGSVFAEMLVVETGGFIDGLREYVFTKTKYPQSYHLVTKRLQTYFRNTTRASFYDQIIAAMLQDDRKARPNAQKLVDGLCRMPTLNSNRTCGCHRTRWDGRDVGALPHQNEGRF